MEMQDYAPGTPSWVDIGVPDIDAAAEFYGELFGWDIPPGDPEAGGYRIAHLRGEAVAGIGPQQNPGPPMWTTYVSVANAATAADAVTAAGGQVVVPAMDGMGQGVMAVCVDDGGAFFSLWQPQAHRGAGRVNEPGALTWNELTTRGFAEAKVFYGAVFGWTANDLDMGDTIYTEWQLDGRTIGGMMPMVGDMWPADLPNHWMVYFGSADTDASCARITKLGGTVHVPPFDTPAGRIAVVTDPAGAVFSVITLAADRAPS